jgi:hypothetical protein
MAADVVAQPLQRRREDRRVLEAVAAPAPAHEFLLHRAEVDTRVLCEQDVDVVEGEGTDVRLV